MASATPGAAPPRSHGVALTRGAGQPELGGHNLRAVSDAIRRADSAGISRVELARATGLASQTVSNVVRRLMSLGLVVESGVHSHGPGKPRTLLQLRPDGAYAFGVHIDPLVVDVILMNLRGHIQARADHAVSAAESPASTLDLLADTMTELLASTGIDAGRVCGVGVAAPGPIDIASGTLADPPLMPRWHHLPLTDELARRTGLPTVVRKDVIAAATGEMWWRGHQDPASFLFCYLGTGTGVAATVNGVLHEGSTGNAGEIGHSPRPDQHGICLACGRKHWGSASAPEAWCHEAADLGLIPALSGTDRLPRPDEVSKSVRALADLARHGQAAAQGIFERAGWSLGAALADLSDLFDVAQVVMGGPYWQVVEPLMMPTVQKQLLTLPVLASLRPVTARTSPHGRDGSAIGAGSLALRTLTGRTLPTPI